MIKIGIPQALLYYQYYPMWKTFFGELGAETVVSPPTSQSTVATGSSRVITDTCLPVKVFCGHVLSLVDRCDYIFIPVFRSMKYKIYNCSKFLGLPDMTRAVIPEAPPLLEVEVDVSRGKRELYKAIYKLGRYFTWNPFKIKQASLAAWQAHLKYQQLMSTQGLTPPQAITRLFPSEESPKTKDGSPASTRATIAVIGHPYLLYDEHINHRLIQRLIQAQVKVLTPEMLTVEKIEKAISSISGKAYWTYEDEICGAGEHYLVSGVDGIIGVMAFGCGPDSLMMDMVRHRASRLNSATFMCLSLEEHTAEAGIVTRLEAFLDMVTRKKKRQAEVCV